MIPFKKDESVKAVILIAFVIWIIYLLHSGNIGLYLSPNLTWLSKVSAILLLLLTAAILLPAKHNSAHCCCGHTHSHTSGHNHAHAALGLSKALIFCVPLLLGFTAKPQVLDSTTLVNSINTAGSLPFFVARPSLAGSFNAPATRPVQPANTPAAPAAPKSATSIPPNEQPAPIDSQITETDLVQLALSDNPDQIYNHAYRLTGFVYKDPRLAKNQFVITRFVITCCVVDAQPLGIIAELPSASSLEANTWLEAEGVLKKRAIKDSDQINPVSNFQTAENTAPYFIVTKLKKIPTPKDPYLSPPQ
ncbi:TIGR03943 family protein [Desulfosporosinus sp. PR]|uniref:TIGR03943 family putative permease subunit n=1 Tax=Candidatus Desulfosporosinus nitrosoreducens TaxID=3401928 RepID=UPI0027F5DEE9|nr:TIGR03943 family protein [Desulfosporosinus sp. PR]MDQ7093777.1 TIGR03943 family protein [Desulfosporosinus sp. PR]